MIETSPEDLTLRNDITGALIAGGHWHGGGNYEICATISHLCKIANERDELVKQRSAFAGAIADRIAALEHARKNAKTRAKRDHISGEIGLTQAIARDFEYDD